MRIRRSVAVLASVVIVALGTVRVASIAGAQSAPHATEPAVAISVPVPAPPIKIGGWGFWSPPDAQTAQRWEEEDGTFS